MAAGAEVTNGPPDDTRGIIDPVAMLRVVDLARYPGGDALDGLVEWFWSVSWDLPPGEVHDQQILNHPSGHISIGTVDDAGIPLDPAQGRVYGVLTGVSLRRLTVSGWTVAARTTVGGLGVFLDRSARLVVDRQLTFAEGLPGLAGSELIAEVGASSDRPRQVELLRLALQELVARRPRALVAEAREVAEMAAAAEQDRSVCRVEHLSATAGVSVRTLQRLFDRHVGVGPSFVIRRWRIIEAAEAALSADGDGSRWRGWASVAAELGYADQAHLTRDFRRHLGTSPSMYVARNAAGR